MIGEVVQRRNLVKQLALRDLKLRYERSMLGFLWSLLNPLVMIVIYTLFFSMVIRIGVDRYWVFLVSLLLPWNFVTKGILGVAQLPYQSGYLLNRAAFPAESLIFSGMLSSLVDFLLEMTIFSILLVILGANIFPGVLILPVLVGLLAMFTTGISMFFAVAYVFFRDTQYIAGLFVSAWFYLSPVFYPVGMVPEQFQTIYSINPIVHFAECFRSALYDGGFPSLTSLGITAAVSVGMFVLGYLYFNYYKRQFAELV